MRTVVVLAVAALVALILALITGNTFAAIAVVLLALAGIVLLVRDWRSDGGAEQHASGPAVDEPAPVAETLTGDEFSPDVAGSDKF
ncbi:MAG: hypothetical protein ACR2JI_03935 [Mycobacterium sp.]